MAKKNISFTKEGGMRVGYKEMGSEEYSAKTQNVIVNAWNLSSWPEYKSRFWNKDAAINQRHKSKPSGQLDPAAVAGGRPANVRHSSSHHSIHD